MKENILQRDVSASVWIVVVAAMAWMESLVVIPPSSSLRYAMPANSDGYASVQHVGRRNRCRSGWCCCDGRLRDAVMVGNGSRLVA